MTAGTLPPSEPTDAILRRPALETQIGRATIVVVRGPQGSGRTTLVSEWSRHTDNPVAWITVDTANRTRPEFWHAVLDALVETGTLHAESQAAQSRTALSSLTDLRAVLVRGLQSLPPVTLVVDDADNLTDDTTHSDLLAVIDHAPNLRIVTTTSGLSPFETDQIRMRHDVAVITPDQLVMDDREIGDLVTHILPTTADPGKRDEAERTPALIARLTGGHAVHVRATLDLIVREGVSVDELERRIRELGDELLPTALTGTASPDDIAAARRLSIADQLTPELATELTGRDDAPALLTSGVRRGFVTRLPGETSPVYVLDPTARESLRRALETHHRKEIPHLTRLVAQSEHRRGRTFPALRAALAAGDTDLAMNVCIGGYSALIDNPKELAELLGSRPLTDYRHHPLLAVLLAFAYVHHNPRQNRVRAIEAALAGIAFGRMRGKRLDTVERVMLAVSECAAARAMGRPDAGLPVGRRAKTLLDELDIASRDRLRVGIGPASVHIGLSLYYGGATADAVQVLERIAALTRTEDASAHFEGNALLAGIVAFEGDMRRTRAHLEPLRDPGWPRELREGMIGLGAEAAEAWVALEEGRYADAAARTQTALNRHPTQEHWPWMVRVRTLALIAQNRSEEALQLLDADRSSPDYLPACQRMSRMLDVTRALLLTVLSRHTEARSLLGNPTLPQASIVRARMHLLLNDPSAALAAMHGKDPERQSGRDLVDLFLLRAACGHRLGRAELRDDNLRRALMLLDRLGLRHPFVMLAPDDRSGLFAAAGTLTHNQTSAVGNAPAWSPSLLRELSSLDAYWPNTLPAVAITAREQDVLAGLAEGLDRRALAERLGISPNTVKTLTRSLYRKLNASSRDEALRAAAARGLHRH